MLRLCLPTSRALLWCGMTEETPLQTMLISALEAHGIGYLYISELAKDSESLLHFADLLEAYVEDSLDYVLRETPMNSAGYSIVAGLRGLITRADIDHVASHFWALLDDSDWT